MNLFEQNRQNTGPLAEILRPKTLEEFCGQRQVLHQNSAINNLISNKKPFSAIIWGPPGCGKTSFARLLAPLFDDALFVALSAVESGIKDIKQVALQAKERLNFHHKKTILFIDEIHRFNKTQQDALLPYLENGSFYLIGATTENPSFQINGALLSRLQVLIFKQLEHQDILEIIRHGFSYLMKNHGKIKLDPEVGEFISNLSAGDARSALNLCENSYFAAKTGGILDLKILENLSQKQATKHSRDDHFNLISALQKSIRGSDENAAIYYLARLIAGGEDPRYIARRLIVTASEDIGLADVNALNVALSCFQAVKLLGLPEARIPLAQATIYLAKAPKSNASYKAIDAALEDVQKNGHNYEIPNHLKDGHYQDAKKYGASVDYFYSHNDLSKKQQFLPDAIKDKKYLF